VINMLRYTLPLIPVHSTVTEFTKRCGLLPLKDLTIPNYLQNSFNRSRVRFGSSKELVPFLVFDYEVTFHDRIKFNGLYIDSYKRFRVEWIKI